MKVTSIVLAGGKNLRFGRVKATEMVGGRTLLERVIERLQPLSRQILIVTSREQLSLFSGYAPEVVADVYPEKGPLGGIYTGLIKAQSAHGIVVACDMPFLSTDLLRYLAEQANDFDAVVPRLGKNKVESLHAVYSKRCLSTIKARLERNELGVNSFLATLRVRYVDKAECQRLDPQLLSFFNINYQADLERAIALAAKA